ncbi:MAG: hypothetical protein BWY11_01324 [Firmicutes bacterium ADurb.Bin182]|nr:MAG: hypothetical protein BWY11_01324 [Firmicutes bacterium ADurb.Bin182]
MKIFLDCLPCMLRQVLEASRMTTADPDVHRSIMEDSIKILSEYKKYGCPPDLCRAMHRSVKKHTGIDDPYAQIKQRDISAALKTEPVVRRFLEVKNYDTYWVLKTAAAGNIIDSGICCSVDIEGCIECELEKEFAVCDLSKFEEKLKSAKKLLIVGDNAGETVFDRILAEYFSGLDVFYAVRSEPILNDATMKDAIASGLDKCAKIIETGCTMPGTVLPECSGEFMEIFNEADIVISKGQGNFETLSGCVRQVFYLFKAKCPAIADMLNVDLNGYVFKCI